jgi:predicted transcriptional regulator/transcriptional regulator with XRE-family HTH domain
MRKTFMGVRIKTLREQRGLTQAALAQLLDLSASYLNQIENNQRPLSVPVLLRLQSSLGLDLQFFSEDEEARLAAELHDVVAEAAPIGDVPHAEVRVMAQQMPAMAAMLIRLHRRNKDAQERIAAMASGLGDRSDAYQVAAPQAHEEVRDFFYAHHNHFAMLDERAEAMHDALFAAPASVVIKPRGSSAKQGATQSKKMDVGQDNSRELAARLEAHLSRHHQVTTLPSRSGDQGAATLRTFDPEARTLTIADAEPGQRAFQLATQLAYLEASDMIDRLADAGRFNGNEAGSLARIGLASYFAGALVLPYARFLAAAEAARYDIDLLSRRFAVSFETVCHRLSTMQRPNARGVPFFFIRVDRAGNISKRQSATDFHFSRTGGTCPLWNVYEAFAQAGKVLTQLAQMPDGRTYLWIAHCVSRRAGGYGSPARTFAIGLGCDVRHAGRLVYARGLNLNDAAAATPIGAGCKVCDRRDCAQRAFPALGRELRIDENERPWEPYASI